MAALFRICAGCVNSNDSNNLNFGAPQIGNDGRNNQNQYDNSNQQIQRNNTSGSSISRNQSNQQSSDDNNYRQLSKEGKAGLNQLPQSPSNTLIRDISKSSAGHENQGPPNSPGQPAVPPYSRPNPEFQKQSEVPSHSEPNSVTQQTPPLSQVNQQVNSNQNPNTAGGPPSESGQQGSTINDAASDADSVSVNTSIATENGTLANKKPPGPSQAQLLENQLIVRPILMGLEDTLKLHQDEGGTIELSRLRSAWNFYAFCRWGDLSAAEEKCIHNNINLYGKTHDLEAESPVTLISFLDSMLNGSESKRGFANIRARIKKQLRQDRESLHKVDIALDCSNQTEVSTISKNDIQRAVTIIQGCDEKKAEVESNKLIREMDSGNIVKFHNFVAFGLGRKVMPVDLLVYDIAGYINEKLAPLLIDQKFKNVYHVSVLAFGHEFWYGGTLFQTRPQVATFCEPVKAIPSLHFEKSKDPSLVEFGKIVHCLPIGTTLYTMDELLKQIRDSICRDYHEENFNVTKRSSIDYANALVKFLTGKPVAKSTVDSLRKHDFLTDLFQPAINILLGGFQTDEGKIFHKEERENLIDAASVRKIHESSLSTAVPLSQDDFAERILSAKAKKGAYDGNAGATALGVTDVTIDGNPIMLKEKQMMSDIRLVSATIMPSKLADDKGPNKTDGSRLGNDSVLAQVAACYEEEGVIYMDLRWFDKNRGLLSKTRVEKTRLQRALVKRTRSDEEHLIDKTCLGVLASIYDNDQLNVGDQRVQDYIQKFKIRSGGR